MNSQLLRFFGSLIDPQLKKKYAGPGDVPFDYAGDPSELAATAVQRPSSWSMFVNPELASDYSRAANAPIFAGQQNALANQFNPDVIARADAMAAMEAERRRKEMGPTADTELGILQRQAPDRNALAAGAQTALAEAAQRLRESQYNEQAAKLRPSLFSSFANQAEAGPLTGFNLQNLAPASRNVEDITTGGIHNQASQASLEAANAAREAGLYGTIGGPEAEAYRRDEANRLAAGQAAAERTLTAPRTALAAEQLGGEMYKARYITPPTQQREAALAQTGLNTLGLDQQTLEMLSRGRLFEATHGIPFGAAPQHPTIPTIGYDSVSYPSNPAYVSPRVQALKDSMQQVQEMTGGGFGHKVGAANAGLFKPVVPSIPIGSGRSTVGNTGNGAGWNGQTNSPTPVITNPAGGNEPATNPAGRNEPPAGASVTPQKRAFDEAVGNIAKQDPTNSRVIREKAREALVAEITKAVKLPPQYIGSSVLTRNPATVMQESLDDPMKQAEIIRQLDKLPPQVIQQIYSNALAKISGAAKSRVPLSIP